MAIQSWQNIIDLVRNGEPVSAEVANRAINQLVQRTEHLKTRQDAQSLAQAVFISGAPLEVNVQTGNVVYFNPQSNKFAAAYADVEFKDGLLRPASTANVIGIVIYKDTSDSGVVVLDGWINPSQYEDLDCQYVPMLNNLLVNPNDRGILYLASGAENAGKLSVKPGFVNVPVANLISAANMLIRPPITTTLDTEALKFKLINNIAGSELILQKTTGVFASAPAVGSTVKVYLGNDTPITGNSTADEIKVYLTATIEKYTNYTGSNPQTVHLKNVQFTEDFVKAAFDASGDYSVVFTGSSAGYIKFKVVGATTTFVLSDSPAGTSCYISPVTYNATTGWEIDSTYVDVTKPGWLPANSSVFQNAVKPVDAVFGYNVKQDPVLQQLFPEAVVTAYSVTKDGVDLSNLVVEVNSSGIWWKDPLIQLPWHRLNGKNLLPDVQINWADWSGADAAKIIMPSELHFVYARLNTGGVRMVTSLETTPTSVLKITDPFGNPANTGPLVISADFTVSSSTNGTNGTDGINGTNGTNGTSGSLVVKDITNNFVLIKGHVVERIIGGDNISITSVINNGGTDGTAGTDGTDGQGTVTISITGLDGKLEGQPDILAVDDVLIERDPSLNMFYSVFPKSKASSILGKIDIPGYLTVNTYQTKLEFTFVALHSSGSVTPPNLTLTLLNLPNLSTTTKQNLATATTSTAITVQPWPATVDSRDCFKSVITLPVNAIPGATIFFKLTRSSSDSYPTKFGLISTVYKFVKVS